MDKTLQAIPKYLGDGVYASFDGYQIWLHLGSHNNPRLVALEPQVMDALCVYADEVFGRTPKLI